MRDNVVERFFHYIKKISLLFMFNFSDSLEGDDNIKFPSINKIKDFRW